MTDRRRRLENLVRLQDQLKSMHEMRHAGHVARSAEADLEARDLVEKAEAGSPIAALFGDLYARRIGAAMTRREAHAASARDEVAAIARESARGSMVGRELREERRHEERRRADLERLDAIERRRR